MTQRLVFLGRYHVHLARSIDDTLASKRVIFNLQAYCTGVQMDPATDVDIALQQAYEYAKSKFRIFLAGPYIHPDQKPSAKAKKYRAHRLRFSLYHQIQKNYNTPLIGENELLLKSSRQKLKTMDTVSTIELFAARKMNGIIIIPSSPGSFCELGLFTSDYDTCGKMLILIDAQYENRQSYLTDGPVKRAERYHATISYVDYDDTSTAWNVSQEFLEDRLSRSLDQDIHKF